MKMVDWLQLPYELLVVIANQLLCVEDFLSFSSVCRSWRLVYLNKDWMSRDRVPWLMLNEYSERNVPKRKNFNLSRFKFYNLPLPEAHGCRCWGTSHGWIVIFGQGFAISLLNPFTRVRINLPQLSILRSQLPSEDDWFAAIQKAIVLKIRDSFVTMIICAQHRYLAYSKPGDRDWTPIQFTIPVRLLHVVCFKDQILGVTMVGNLVLLDIDGPDSPRASRVASPPADAKGWWNVYLVESSDNLLLVFHYNTLMGRFKVYKLDISTSKWVALDDLGDSLLFVDDYGCTSVSAYGFLKPNCIYSVNDNSDDFINFRHQQKHMTVYNIKDESTEVFWISDNSPSYTCPVWMMPKLW